MKTFLDCLPCLVRQALDAVRMAADDESRRLEIMREVLSLGGRIDLSQPPPAMAQKIHRIIRERTKTDDPYKKVKGRFNEFALKLLPKLKRRVDTSEKPFETAVRLAIAGNIIDLGVKCSLKTQEVEKTIEEALTGPFDMRDFEEFRASVNEAEDILYLADNAGEIVFDRLLIEKLSLEKVTVAVKGKAVINDATIEDARTAGLTDLVKVIDSGDDAPGTILESCSDEFRRRFEEADLIIAKGQGNYETLSEESKNIFFILKAKCPVITRDLGCEVGEMILRKSKIFNGIVDLVKGAK